MGSTELIKRVVASDTLGTETGRALVRLPDVRAQGMRDYCLGVEAPRHPRPPMASGEVPVDLVGHNQAGWRLAWTECGGRSANREMEEYLVAHEC